MEPNLTNRLNPNPIALQAGASRVLSPCCFAQVSSWTLRVALPPTNTTQTGSGS